MAGSDHLGISQIIEDFVTSGIFAASGHSGGLSILRLLLRCTPQAVRTGEIAKVPGVRPDTLSAHLTVLEGAGLITARRKGRMIPHAARLAERRALVATRQSGISDQMGSLPLCLGTAALMARPGWLAPRRLPPTQGELRPGVAGDG